MEATLRVQITDVDLVGGVALLRLQPVSTPRLPPWTAGAHIDLVLPSGLVRQYSLSGDPQDLSAYRIAVLRQDDGRGGSTELHRIAEPGFSLEIRGPRNHFPLVPADNYLFVAGGIGVTPLLPMARHADRQGATWRMLYGGRTRSSMAFVSDLQELGGDRLDIVPQDECGLLDISHALASLDDATVVYCCGPEPLIDVVLCTAATLGIQDRVHIERFARSPAAAAAAAQTRMPFEVECVLSNVTFTVPIDRSILDLVLERADPDYPWSCTEGYCGSCVTTVLAGIPDHRDDFLTDEERAEGNVVMICVDRSVSDRLVLEL